MSEQMPAAAGAPAPAAIPRRKLDARVRNFRDKTMVAGREQAFELSETAAFVWKSLDGKRSVSDVAALLSAEYDVDHETALADVGELLGTLAGAGLVTYADGE